MNHCACILVTAVLALTMMKRNYIIRYVHRSCKDYAQTAVYLNLTLYTMKKKKRIEMLIGVFLKYI